MLGYLLQWPTLLTLIMFPVLTWAYVRLARREEQELRAAFGERYTRYTAVTPAFGPRFRREGVRRAQGESQRDAAAAGLTQPEPCAS